MARQTIHYRYKGVLYACSVPVQKRDPLLEEVTLDAGWDADGNPVPVSGLTDIAEHVKFEAFLKYINKDNWGDPNDP